MSKNHRVFISFEWFLASFEKGIGKGTKEQRHIGTKLWNRQSVLAKGYGGTGIGTKYGRNKF
ncbi:MAG: hypothetical protein WC765_07290 [Phycisphaerae bacterium]